MKENPYDREPFFRQYSKMRRSEQGLAGAGEWHALKKLMPDFAGKRVLDLGCGFGWHCVYAAEQGALSVIGVDISLNMLAEAKRKTRAPQIQYIQAAIEDYSYPAEAFDIVISSLAFHYVASFDGICQNVWRCLVPGGDFVFSVEHPVFTAYGTQDWIYADDGSIRCWPVDRYFSEGPRESVFLGEKVLKYHRTLTTYAGGLTGHGFSLSAVSEPEPDPSMLPLPGMSDDLRRPIFLLMAAKKNRC